MPLKNTFLHFSIIRAMQSPDKYNYCSLIIGICTLPFLPRRERLLQEIFKKKSAGMYVGLKCSQWTIHLNQIHMTERVKAVHAHGVNLFFPSPFLRLCSVQLRLVSYATLARNRPVSIAGTPNGNAASGFSPPRRLHISFPPAHGRGSTIRAS